VLLAALASAAEGPSARDILKKAVAAQGEMPEVKDVTLSFEGEIRQEGQVNTVERTYWYRSSDSSFRMRTRPKVMEKLVSDRGVVGEGTYWELTQKGEMIELSRGNRDDAAQIRAIQRERSEFQRMLRMVLLARFDGDGWQVALAQPAPVLLDTDQPHQASDTLGNREETTYHVLDLKREGEPDLRLYVHTGDFTVRKAIEFDPKAPGQAKFVYYFSNYEVDPEAKLLLPRFLSAYHDTPKDKAKRDDLLAAKGRPSVRLNKGLADAELKPAGK
jgi:hypothetical protein